MTKAKILFTENIHEKGMNLLREHFEVVVANSTKSEDLEPLILDADAFMVRSSKVDNDLILKAQNLKVIGRHGTGLDNIDVPFMTEHGIKVVNTPGANSYAVAEHVIGMILAISHKFMQNDEAIRAGEFSVPGKSLPALTTELGYGGHEIAGKTLGIIGFGKIGQSLAKLARNGFGLHILAYDAITQGQFELEEGMEWADLSKIYAESDFISLHVPLLPSTKHMVAYEQFEQMKKTCIVINCARGGIVKEDDLCRALDEGLILGAGMDVFEVEPVQMDNPMLKNKRILLTSHAAAMTEETLIKMAMMECEGVKAVLEGETPFNQVNLK